MALIHIWGDESSQNGHKHMVLGTIWQNPICAADLERDINNLRKITNFQKEFHWTEMKGHQVKAYKGLVEIYKEYMDQGLLKFRSLVVDQTDRTHKIFSDNDELHFYKMFFWLITKRLLPQNQYDIFLDRKSNSVSGRLSDLESTLNNRFINDYYSRTGKFPIDSVVRRVEPRDGTQIELQLADVFAGAIAYVKNNHGCITGISPNNPKVQLVSHIQSVFGFNLNTCHRPTDSSGFNVWCFQR